MEPRAGAGKPAVIAVVPNAAGRASIAQNAAAHGVVTSAAIAAAAVAVNFYNNAIIILLYYICQHKPFLKLIEE